MPREKDIQLADRCRAVGTVATDALGWLQDNASLVGTSKEGLERVFKRSAVTARKLGIAAERPMSVGVFGASQAGKSFLTGGLIAPREKPPVRVLFGSGDNVRKLDFLSEINPQGGNETTGLVTRFSIQPHEAIDGHEVTLRLLSEVDLVKIFANTWVFDLTCTPESDAYIERIEQVGTEALQSAEDTPVDNMRVEDVFELREYLEHNLSRHPLAQAAGDMYWAMAEELLPRLRPEARARVLAPLWGELPEFTDLYRELKGALDQLGHAEWAYVPLSAILDRAAGILHAETLHGLDEATGTSTERIMVAVKGASTVSLSKAVVTALTAELRVTLDQAPWPFFEHTDFLDFPGARSREDSTPEKILRDPKLSFPRANCVKRGKIAVLFDKYAADLDLNTMLLCIGPENQEVKKLPELIEDWIGQTHGSRPQDRKGKRTTLFLCLTKADMLLNVVQGGDAPLAVRNRMSNNIDNFPGWTKEWAPGTSFNNTYLIRNPSFERKDLFGYKKKSSPESDEIIETGLLDAAKEHVANYRSAFLDDDLVKAHVSSAEETWDALFVKNDGGLSYLAKSIAPVCDPDLKFEQIEPRIVELASQLRDELKNFHESGDIEEQIRTRVGRITDACAGLIDEPTKLGPFLNELQASEAAIGYRFLNSSETDESSTNKGRSTMDKLMQRMRQKEPTATQSEPPPPEPQTRFGHAAVSTWREELERKVNDKDLCAAYGIESEYFRHIVQELDAAARRLNLPKTIEEFVNKATEYATRRDEVVHRVAIGSTRLINNLVNFLGTDYETDIDGDGSGNGKMKSPFPRREPLSVGSFPQLSVDQESLDMERLEYAAAWLMTLEELTRQNASAGREGLLVDVEQNQRLGNLIEILEP